MTNSTKTTDRIAKVHLMVNGQTICGAVRAAGRQGTDNRKTFAKLGDEQCKRCARLVAQQAVAKPAKVKAPKAPAKADAGKGSALRLAAGAKAAATRLANRIAKFGEPKPRPVATGKRHEAALKAHLTMTERKLKGTKGKVREALKARIASYQTELNIAA